ncbi:MAG TPA: signal protein PDZ, partial [Prochlorococcus sp.]
MNEIVDIYLDLSEPASQSIKVTLKWIPRSKSLQWSLPIWTPGSYTIREHVQHLHSLNLKQDSKLVPIQRVSSSGWKTELDSLEPLSLNYVIEARQLTVRTCYLDPDFSSLCLAAAVVEIGSHRWSTHRLNVVVPDGWNTYIPLTGEEIFIADDYDQLVDAPLHAGCFQSTSFTVNKNNHQLICIGEPPMGWPSNFVED